MNIYVSINAICAFSDLRTYQQVSPMSIFSGKAELVDLPGNILSNKEPVEAILL